MKRIKHTEEQIIKALKRFEAGEKAAALAREFGITLATFYNWKAKYGGMEVSEAKKLKALEEENRRLKRAVADLLLDNQMLKDGANTLNFLSLDFSVTRYRVPNHRRYAHDLSEMLSV